MEIYHVLPEGQRNKFADPEQHLRPLLRRQSPNVIRTNEGGIDCSGQLILHTLRAYKLMKVKDLIAKCSELYREGATDYVEETSENGVDFLINFFLRFFLPIKFIDFDQYTLCAIKYLANDGFIKLTDAERFENSEVILYHATAEPDFRAGKFQL